MNNIQQHVSNVYFKILHIKSRNLAPKTFSSARGCKRWVPGNTVCMSVWSRLAWSPSLTLPGLFLFSNKVGVTEQRSALTWGGRASSLRLCFSLQLLGFSFNTTKWALVRIIWEIKNTFLGGELMRLMGDRRPAAVCEAWGWILAVVTAAPLTEERTPHYRRTTKQSKISFKQLLSYPDIAICFHLSCWYTCLSIKHHPTLR